MTNLPPGDRAMELPSHPEADDTTPAGDTPGRG